jgi:hypothetical protein
MAAREDTIKDWSKWEYYKRSYKDDVYNNYFRTRYVGGKKAVCQAMFTEPGTTQQEWLKVNPIVWPGNSENDEQVTEDEAILAKVK